MKTKLGLFILGFIIGVWGIQEYFQGAYTAGKDELLLSIALGVILGIVATAFSGYVNSAHRR